MISVDTMLILLGLIIYTGFGGTLLFEKTKIPDLLLLIFIGIVIGFIFDISSADGKLTSIAPYFGSLALIIILFEGGLHLDIQMVLKQLKATLILVITVFLLSMFGIAIIYYLATDYGIYQGLLLGSILGCTSGAIVIPVVQQLNISKDMKTLLVLEASVVDAFAVVFTMTLLTLSSESHVQITHIGKALFDGVTNAILISMAAGFLWLKVMTKMQGKPLIYMLTFAAMVLIYAGVEYIDGSGAIAVLIFGMILSNGNMIISIYHKKKGIKNYSQLISGLETTEIKGIHQEISFFTRTFFFVFLGLIISFNNLTLWVIFFSIGILFVLIATRFASVLFLSSGKNPMTFINKITIWSMMPRGLASVVLSVSVLDKNIEGTENFAEITFLIVMLTNILMTAFVIYFERKKTN